MPVRRKILLLPLILFLGLSQCSSPERSLPVTNLSKDLEPIRTEFNKDAGKVRLLLLVDPT